jgi:hypothetical protein
MEEVQKPSNYVKNVVVTKLENLFGRMKSVSLPQLTFCYPFDDISDEQNRNWAKNEILGPIRTNLLLYNDAAIG